MSTAEWSEFDGLLAQPGNADLLQQAASIEEATGEVVHWPNMTALRAQAPYDRAYAMSSTCWLTVEPPEVREVSARTPWGTPVTGVLPTHVGRFLLLITATHPIH